MPVLPVHKNGSFKAILGTMLYPRIDEQEKAKVFASQDNLVAFARARSAGIELPVETIDEIFHDPTGVELIDKNKREREGLWVGEVFIHFSHYAAFARRSLLGRMHFNMSN